MREEGIKKRGGEVLQLGESEAAMGDDVVLEGADVDVSVGGHVEGEELGVLGTEESKRRCAVNIIRGGGGDELVLELGGRNCVAEESIAVASEGFEHCFKLLECGRGIGGLGRAGGGDGCGAKEEEK